MVQNSKYNDITQLLRPLDILGKVANHANEIASLTLAEKSLAQLTIVHWIPAKSLEDLTGKQVWTPLVL